MSLASHEARGHSDVVGGFLLPGVLLGLGVSVLLGGCSESVRQYVKLDRWTQSHEQPVIISGSARQDAAAYRGGGQGLTEADWNVLQSIAPRPAWERLLEARDRYLTERTDKRPATQPATPGRKGKPDRPAVPPDVSIVTRPDGKLQILYKLRHYGGALVSSVREGGTDRRKVSVVPPNLSPLLDLVGRHLGEKGEVSPLPSQNALAITCDPTVKDSLLGLLASVDRPNHQVEITVRIFEVGHDFDFQYGAKLLLKHLGGEGQQGLATAFSAKDFVGAVVDPLDNKVVDPGGALRLLNVFSSAGITLDATFQALADTGLIKVVACPRMTVAAGQTAYMLAGQELPIQSAKISNDKLVTEKITYKPIGVQLYITPQIVGPDNVKLHVVTTVSAISGFAPTPTLDEFELNQAIVNPILDSREAETYVTIDNGHTLVIGGLRMVRTITREQKVPGLGDIEFLEWLFKNHRSQKRVNDLYFFVTPTLIQ